MIRTRALRKLYGSGPAAVEALRGIDLDVAAGEVVGLMGPSGSGKTTLLNLLGALDRPTSGRIEVDGRDLAGLSEREATRFRAAHLGFVFQSFNLFRALTARENVEYPLMLARVAAGERRRRAGEILERVGLAGRAGRRPGQLSGGEKQRVAVARALVHGPRLVLADEPTANLDSENGGEVVGLLVALNRERGSTLVICSHDPAVIARVGRVLAMKDGRLQP